jgi:hypothetical protein
MTRARAAMVGLVAFALVGLGVARGAIAQDEAVPADDHTVVVVHVVRNGHPAAGSVTIRDEEGHETTCTVNESGECELSSIGGGRHTVEATGSDGTVSAARVVMIPDGGKVSLIVQLPSPNAD